MKYTCTYCKKEYTKKGFYEKHVKGCEIVYASKQTREEIMETIKDTPNMTDMYMLFQQLSVKVTKLEKEVDVMKKYITKTQKKISVLEWLENSYEKPRQDFDVVMEPSNLEVTNDNLEFCFKNSVAEAVIEIFKNGLHDIDTDSENTAPIVSFYHRQDVFYVFNDGKWSKYTFKEFDGIVGYIINKIARLYNKWWVKNLSDPNYDYQVLSKITQNFTKQVDDKNKQRTIRSVRKGIAALCKVTIPTFIDKNENETSVEVQSKDEKSEIIEQEHEDENEHQTQAVST